MFFWDMNKARLIFVTGRKNLRPKMSRVTMSPPPWGRKFILIHVGGTNGVTFGVGNGSTITNETAQQWVLHNPSDIVNIASNAGEQLNPLQPAAGQSVDVWVKVGYQLQISQCSIYYTTDANSPKGSYGVQNGARP